MAGKITEKNVDFKIKSPIIDLTMVGMNKIKLNEITYEIDLSYSTYKSVPKTFKNSFDWKLSEEGNFNVISGKFLIESQALDLGVRKIDYKCKIGDGLQDYKVTLETSANKYLIEKVYKREKVSNNGVSWTVSSVMKDDLKYIDVKGQSKLLISDSEIKLTNDVDIKNQGTTNMELTWNRGTEINVQADINLEAGLKLRNFFIKTLSDGYQIKVHIFNCKINFKHCFL